LAAKLTAWRIDIKSLPEASADALNKLQTDPEYAVLLEHETAAVIQIGMILAKKAEGRPVMPEEYQALSQFVDRVERGLVRQREKEKHAEEERQRIAQAVVPDAAYDIPLEDLGISLRYATILGGAGFPTVGDLLLQLNLDPDVILGLDGIGPKAMKDVEEALSKLDILKPVEEEPPVSEVVAAPAVEGEVAVSAESEVPQLEAAAVEEQPVEASAQTPETVEISAEVETAGIQVSAEELVPVEQAAETAEDQSSSDFDKIFSLQPEVLDMVVPLAEDETEEEDVDDKKKKKKKKKFVKMEYDPDKDVVVYTKKSKREDSEGWEGEW
jgi:N utilization substance protein A